MPLRFNFFPSTARLHRHFTSSAIRRDNLKPNHYETLQIPTTATPAEVKKSFYNLSKIHHPDHNPDDPSASQRFVQISEAYATLGTPAKRQAYDREHLSSQSQSQTSSHPRGSYSSSGPVGGRPASGLSRRRTQFRGPPPSFYRSGGWGEHSAKRQAAQESSSEFSNTGTGAETNPGMGYGQGPQGCGVPHFDREGHMRTHENNTRRWARRQGMKDGWIPSEAAPRGTLANFFFVGGILSVGIIVPTMIIDKMISASGNEKKS